MAFIWLIDTVLQIIQFIVIASVIMSWLIMFDVINLRNEFVRAIYNALTGLTEPMLRPIRSIVPAVANLDLSPLILLIGVSFLRILVTRDLAPLIIGA